MFNQRKLMLLLCTILCSAQTWNMEGEDKNQIREELIEFIAKKRKDASDNVNMPCLAFLARQSGYGDVQKEDLQLLLDFVPEKNEDIRQAVTAEWSPDEALSQERKNAWQTKTYPDVVTDLKESKVKRLKELTGQPLIKDDIYATMHTLDEKKAREMILQDLADLQMFETEIQKQKPSIFTRISGLWSK